MTVEYISDYFGWTRLPYLWAFTPNAGIFQLQLKLFPTSDPTKIVTQDITVEVIYHSYSASTENTNFNIVTPQVIAVPPYVEGFRDANLVRNLAFPMTGTGGILEVLANEGANPLFSRPNFNDLYVTSRIQIHS